jgi:SSS family solute:Na+ symporter
MGALELLGMAGQSYQYGIMTAHFYFIGAVPAMLFLAIYMMPFYYSKKITSIPGYLKERYNESTRRLNAVAFAIMTLLMAGINMYSMALAHDQPHTHDDCHNRGTEPDPDCAPKVLRHRS